MSETGVLCVLCSCPDQDAAEQLAEQIVSNHLAACVNVLPGMTSWYRWEGKMQRAAEVLLVIKCTERSWPEIQAFVLDAHPHDNPELIALPVISGSSSYLNWVASECAPPRDDRH